MLISVKTQAKAVIKNLFIWSFWILFSGCISGSQTDAIDPKIKDKDEKAEDTTEAEDTDSSTNVEVLSSDENQITAKLSPDSTEIQTLSAPENSAVKGSTVQFPPGSLAVSTDITLEEGQSLASGDFTSELGLSTDTEVQAASAPVLLTSSEEKDPANPFTLALNLGSNLSLAEQGTMVIFYKIIKYSSGKTNFVGIIPADKLERDGDKVKFEAKYFGLYQATYIPDAIEVPEEKESQSAPVSKRRFQEQAETNDEGTSEGDSDSTDEDVESGNPTFAMLQGEWNTACDPTDPETKINYRNDTDGKEFEFNPESIVFDEEKVYTIGQEDFHRLDFENNFLDGAGRINMKATSGSVTITDYDPIGNVLEGSFNLTDFKIDHDDGEALSGTVTGSFRLRLNMDLPADGTFYFIADGSSGGGDLATLSINVGETQLEIEQSSVGRTWVIRDDRILIEETLFFDNSCSDEYVGWVSSVKAQLFDEGFSDPFGESGFTLSQLKLKIEKHELMWGADWVGQHFGGECGLTTAYNVPFDVTGRSSCGHLRFFNQDAEVYNHYLLQENGQIVFGEPVGQEGRFPDRLWQHIPLTREPN